MSALQTYLMSIRVCFYGKRFTLFFIMIFLLSACTIPLPIPENADSTMLFLSIEAQRNIGSNKPDIVVITRKEDGENYEHSSKDGKYYFFTNLPKGTYQIKSANILVKGNTTTTQSGNFTASMTTHTNSSFNFSEKIITSSSVSVQKGKAVFMGHFLAEGTAKLFPPGAIEITNIRLNKSQRDKDHAFTYFKRAFKDSPWINYLN